MCVPAQCTCTWYNVPLFMASMVDLRWNVSSVCTTATVYWHRILALYIGPCQYLAHKPASQHTAVHHKWVHFQGPPGTGKTRTILALLSVIMHAAPPGSARLLKGSTTSRPILQVGYEDQKRLWLQTSPWLIGENPRCDSAGSAH